MVLKSASVFSCLLPARFGFGTQEDERDVLRSRANTVPSNGDIGESPNPAHRPGSPRQKRSSFTTFFAFSSKKKPSVIHLQRDLLSPQSVPGRWLSGSTQTEVHLINHSAIPSPLRTDEEEYYYSYYTSPPSTSLHPDPANTAQSRQQDLIGNPDLSSTITHPSHTQIQHPFAYSTSFCSTPHSKTIGAAPSLRHATSQTFDQSPTLVYSRAASSHVGHQTSQSHTHPSQPKLKTSISTPNLAAGTSPGRPRSLTKKKPPTRSRGQERLLSAETWWDALLSPSPRFKVRQALRPHTVTGTNGHPASEPGQGEPSRTLGIAFPSVQAARPRAVSATSNVRPSVPIIARSRSATDLGQPSTSALRTGFEPALETLVDEPTPAPERGTGRDADLSSLEPPPSLTQVLDEGQAFEAQRAQWKRQATHSIGNKRTRSYSRARSKSLSEKHVRGHGTSENAKVHFNLDFLAARSLLGSQSTMPTVHAIGPSSSSGHSKAYSHSHSGHSHTHTSHSRTYSHSHSHSHSLTASNSSKSSRNQRGHSRSGSWSRTAFLKAGALCGITQDESYSAAVEEKVPPSSRADLQGVIHISAATHAGKSSDTAQASPSPDVPTDEVGIAISPTPPVEAPSNPAVPGPSHAHNSRREQDDRDSRRPSKRSHKSSEYAGPHPSAVDSQLPQLAAASTVSLRHRLPPRAAIFPPVSPISHPYRTVYDQARKSATPQIPVAHATTGSRKERTPYPHISLSHADFEQYGVGEALVYASFPSPGVSEIKQPDVDNNSSGKAKQSFPEEQSSSFGTFVSQRDGSDTASMAMNTPPSLTNSTIQMVMSAFNNPDDLDEFQDLFYKPHPISGDGQESTTTINRLPIDVHSSASSSPLTYLVRKLSEEVHGSKDSPRMLSEPMYLQRTESQDQPSSESVSKIVFMGLARSPSPPPMEPSLQLQGGEASTTQPMMVVPEDVESSYTASMLESPPLVHENDTFGRPIKHGQLEAVTAPSPTRTSVRVSTHLSIQETESEVDESTFLSPPPRRHGLSVADAVRSSSVTTSDVSQMSGIFDFPLPPSTRPGGEPAHTSVLHSYFEPTPSVSESRSESLLEDDFGIEQDWRTDSEDGELSGDVGETVQALRSRARFEGRRTFGVNDDEDFMTQLQLARHGRESPSL